MQEPGPKRDDRVRRWVFPISSGELKKFIPLFLILFLCGFNYSLLRIIKDALVLTAKGGGAEAIPFIKVWVMLPGAVLMTFLFANLSNRFSREQVFYIIVGIFLTFFMAFSFVLYPNRGSLHLHYWADRLELFLPVGLSGLVSILRTWTFTLFYAMAELWGNIVIFLMFWGFANDINSLDEGKRYYPLLALSINVSGIIAGLIPRFLSIDETAWGQTLQSLTLIIFAAGLVVLYLFRWLHKQGLSKSCPKGGASLKKEKKRKMSIGESLVLVWRSPYLFSLAVIVVSYNLVINLLEVVWKGKVTDYCSELGDCFLYMADITTYTSLIACITSLLVTGTMIRRFGWLPTALVTPIILLITSLLFFGVLLFEDAWVPLAALFAATPLGLAVFVGSLQNCLSRAAKYTVFDVTKELSFNAIPYETSIRGKAAIDGIGTRFGKSGGSVFYQVILLCVGSISASIPIIACIVLGMIPLWLGMVFRLGREFESLTHGEPLTVEKTEAASGLRTDPDRQTIFEKF